MKQQILFILGLLYSVITYCQNDEKILKGGNYYLDPVISITQNNFSTTINKPVNLDSFKGKNYKLTVKSIIDNKVYFDFWEFSNLAKDKEVNGINKDNTYVTTIEEFKKLTSPYYNRIEWRAGFFNVPFKLRFNDFDFTSNVNLGINIGARYRWSRFKKDGFSIEPLFGFGVTAITLDEANSVVTESTNSSAFSINTGVLFHVTKHINLGVLYGFDNLSSKDQNRYNWKYNGKGWLGLGINVSFSVGGDNSGDTGSN